MKHLRFVHKALKAPNGKENLSFLLKYFVRIVHSSPSKYLATYQFIEVTQSYLPALPAKEEKTGDVPEKDTK